MKTRITKTLALIAAFCGLQLFTATTAWAVVPAGTKAITYSSLPGVTTGDSTIYDYMYGAFKEGGTLELSLKINYNGNNCGKYQCIFHAGAKDTGFSLYENGGPNLILSTKNQTSDTYEMKTNMAAGDHTILVRFTNNGTDSAAVNVTVDGTNYDRGTWTWSSMSWSSTAAERNRYSMGCQAPGWTSEHTLQTTTVADNTITATYTPILHKMYSNRLSGGTAVVEGGTYGALTVPKFGYKATTVSTWEDLSNTASGEEITGSYANIIQKTGNDGDTRQHTFAGWFCPSNLSSEKILWFAYSKGFITYNDDGYKVSVTTEGKIKIVKTNKDAADKGTAIYSTDVVFNPSDIKWAHVAVAFEWGGGGTTEKRWLKPTLYVNGQKKTLSDSTATIGSNLAGGDNGAAVRIGTGVSAAGIYVDQTGIDATYLADVAGDYVVEVTPNYSATISTASINWSDISPWTPAKPAEGFEADAELTLTNTVASTLTLNEETSVAKVSIVNSDNALTIPYSGLSKLSATTFDFSQAAGGIKIDLSGITAGEQTIASWNVAAGASNVTSVNAPDGWDIAVGTTGIKMWRKDTLSRNNPVTGAAAQYTYAFVGSTDGDWGTVDNWRVRTNNLLVQHSGNVPGAEGSGIYEPLLLDGNLMGSTKTVTYNGTLDGWAINYAFLNGVHATVATLGKIQEPSNPMSICVDAQSSLVVSAFGGNSYQGILNLYVAAPNGITFPAYAKGNTFYYYFTNNASVKFTGAVTAGTHQIKAMDFEVGATAAAKRVLSKKLIALDAASSATFEKADGIVVSTDNPDVTPTYQSTRPTTTDDPGKYTIETASDGVYVYYVAYAGVTEPLSYTVTKASENWSEVTWTDADGVQHAHMTGVHQYEITGGANKLVQDVTLAEGAQVTVVSGTLEIPSTTSIGGETYTVNEGATLLVEASGLAASKVTNNGTIKFAGGSSVSPITVNYDTTDLGQMSLAADTFVKATMDTQANKIYKVTGTDLTSCFAVTGSGLSEGTDIQNLTLVAAREGGAVWIERGIGTGVALEIPTGYPIKLNTYNPEFVALSGAGAIEVHSGASPSMTINCAEASEYSGASAVPFTVGGSAVQTLSGAYTGALTVSAGGEVALTGASTKPSSISCAGKVTVPAGRMEGAVTLSDASATLDLTTTTEGAAEYSITSGTFAQNGATVLLNGEALSSAYYFVSGNKLVKAAARIDTTPYETVAAAITAVQPGQTQTITLLKSCSEASLSAGDKTFTLDLGSFSLTGTLTIGGSGEVTLTTLPAANTLKIAGSGRLVYNNATIPTLNGIWDSTWTGTFAYGGCNTSKTNWDLTSYYNGADSKFEFNGTLTTSPTESYFAKMNWSLGDLIVNGSITFNNGYSTIDGGAETVYTFKALKGTGSITTSISKVRPVLRFETMDDFTGSISLTGYRVVVGTSEVTISSSAPANSTITLLDRANLSASTLTATAGIDVKTAVGGSTTLASATTFEDNAEIDVRSSTLTASSTLTFGKHTKIRVTDDPVLGEPIKVINKTNAGTEAVTTDVTVYVGTSEDPFTTYDFSLAYKENGLYLTPIERREHLCWDRDNSVWTNKTGQAVTIDDTCVLNARDGDVITFTETTTPHSFVMPETGTVTLGSGARLLTVSIEVPTAATLALGWNDLENAYDKVITGAGAVDITGAGVLLTANNTFSGTMTVKSGGLLKMGANNCLNNVSAATVETGGVIDMNGKKDNGSVKITLNGGKMINGGADIGGSCGQQKLILGADSELNLTNDWGLIASSYHATDLDLGTYTLTKNGSATFKLITTTVTGSGTLAINEGTVLIQNYGSGGVSCANGTFAIGANGTLSVEANKTLTIGNISGTGGTINNAGTITAFTLSGTVNLSGAGTYNAITTTEGAVAKIGNRLDYFTVSGPGTVEATLTAAQYVPGGSVTVFKAGDTTPSITLKDGSGNDIPTDYYTVANGVVTFKREAKIGDTDCFTLAQAIGQATTGATVTLLDDVVLTPAITIGENKNLTFDGASYEITGTGFNGPGTSKLTVIGGKIGITDMPGSYELKGGKYKDKTSFTAVASGYHYVELATAEGAYTQQVMPGADDPLKPQKAYEVTVGGQSGAVALNATQLATIGCSTESTPEQVTAALQTDCPNGGTKFENLVLDLSNTDATSKPVPAPQQTAPDGKIDFKLGGVDVDLTTGATVTYKVYKASSPDATSWEPASEEVGYSASARVTLESEGVKYYMFDVIVTPAK